MLKQKPRQSNQSSEKVLSIIELLADRGEPMRLMDIAMALGYNASTVLRYLASLTQAGYVEQEPDTQRYYLTFKICAIANQVSSSVSVREIAHPLMKELSAVFNESVCLAVEQQMMVVYIDVAEGPDQMLRTMQRIGNIAPMHCTGIGKLFLTQYTDEELDHFIAIKGMPPFTDRTITGKMQLLDELKKVGQCGYAMDDEECEIGARCLAYPIRDYAGKLIAGISVTGPSSRLTDAYVKGRMAYLEKTADEISKRLGYQQARSDP